MDKRLKHIYEFGPFRLNPAERLLLRAGETVPLTPKAFDLLLALVEQAGHLLEKEALLKAVWPDSFVEENNLADNISKLRKALNENGQKYIETIPKRGYRFVAEVRAQNDASAAPEIIQSSGAGSQRSQPAPPASATANETAAAPAAKQRPRAFLAGVAALLVLTGGGVYLRLRPAPSAAALAVPPAAAPTEEGGASLAILPFNAEPQTEYLADGLAENLTNTLARLPNLQVAARTLAFRYKGKGVNPLQAGRELKVKAVLTGAVSAQQEQLTVQLELLNAATGARLWGERYQRPLAQMMDLQAELSRQLAEQLRLPLSGVEQRRLAKRYTGNQQAYQLFLAGRYHWDKNTPASRQKAVAAFQQALAADARYAPACAWLAAAYLQLGTNGEMSPAEAKAKAQTHASQALALDEEQEVAHFVVGALKLFFEWDAAGAERALTRGLALNPNNVEGCLVHAYYLLFIGETDKALAEVKRGQRLDPLSLLLKTAAASLFYYTRRYDEALAECRQALELDPNYGSAHYWQARAWLEKAQPAEALTALKRWLALTGRDEKSSPDLGYLQAAAGQRAAAQQLLTRLQGGHSGETYVDPFDLARLCLRLGEREQALAWLEQALQRHSLGMMWLRFNPQFDSLRADPRFAALVRRVSALRYSER